MVGRQSTEIRSSSEDVVCPDVDSQSRIITADKKASFKLSFMLLLVVPWQSFPFAIQRTQFCRWTCALWVTATITVTLCLERL